MQKKIPYNEMTELEKIVYSEKEEIDQEFLDTITEKVLRKLTPEKISSHVTKIYDATVSEYTKNQHNLYIVDELIEFMSLLPEKAMVLDIGCGPGRDVLFMSIPNKEFREGLMGRVKNGKTTREKYPIPESKFNVIGIDNSFKMISAARKRQSSLIEKGLLKSDNDERKLFNYFDVNWNIKHLGEFDGIWSCAALFTHTPEEHLESTFNSISALIKENGLFLTTYTTGDAYNKLLLSSTGRIKYFSHPTPDTISKMAKNYGLILEEEKFSDFENGKVVKKNLFVSQLFIKKIKR